MSSRDQFSSGARKQTCAHTLSGTGERTLLVSPRLALPELRQQSVDTVAVVRVILVFLVVVAGVAAAVGLDCSALVQFRVRPRGTLFSRPHAIHTEWPFVCRYRCPD